MKVLQFPGQAVEDVATPSDLRDLHKFREMVRQMREEPGLVVGLSGWEPTLLRPSAYTPSAEFLELQRAEEAS